MSVHTLRESESVTGEARATRTLPKQSAAKAVELSGRGAARFGLPFLRLWLLFAALSVALMVSNLEFAVVLMLVLVAVYAWLERRDQRQAWAPRVETRETKMTGPIAQMAGWQQALICGGLFALMVLLKLRPSQAQREAEFQRLKRDCLHERLSEEERMAGARRSEGSGCALDISRPPSWWSELEWKSTNRR